MIQSLQDYRLTLRKLEKKHNLQLKLEIGGTRVLVIALGEMGRSKTFVLTWRDLALTRDDLLLATIHKAIAALKD